jgi:hypothetical protein
MKLFEDSRGFIFSFGFDMRARSRCHNMICWCDPESKDWEPNAANQAGWVVIPHGSVAPEFVFESRDGSIVAYQPGKCIELRHGGRRLGVQPFVFGVFLLKPE